MVVLEKQAQESTHLGAQVREWVEQREGSEGFGGLVRFIWRQVAEVWLRLGGGNSLTSNPDDDVKLTVPVLNYSPEDVGKPVDGNVMDKSPGETISVCVTLVTEGGSGSTSRLPLECIGLNSDRREGTTDGTTKGVLTGRVGALEGRSTANDCGVLASDGMVLRTDAVSNCIEHLHSQTSTTTNSISTVLHFSAVKNSAETSE